MGKTKCQSVATCGVNKLSTSKQSSVIGPNRALVLLS